MADPARDRREWSGPGYSWLIQPDRVHGSLYTNPRVFELLGREGSNVTVGANFVLAEARERGVQTRAGRVTGTSRCPRRPS